MICPECKTQNPENNRFCGSCGSKLPETVVQGAANGRQTSLERMSAIAAPPRTTSAPAGNPGLGTRQPSRRVEEPREISRMEVERPAARSGRSEGTGVTGPSFLGLSDASDDSGDDDGYSRPYGDDLYRSNWGARFLFALIVLGVVGGLGYMQLKSNHPLQAILGTQSANTAANGQANDSATQPPASGLSAPENQNGNAGGSTTGAANPSSSAQSPDTAETSLKGEPGDERAATAKDKTGALADSSKTKADSAEKSDSSADEKQASDAGDKSASAASDQKATAANSVNDKQEPNAKSKSKSAAKSSSDEKSATSADDGSSESDASDATAAAPARAVDNSEEPVRQAEIYLEGKGVPQNCDEGVGILRAAEARGNSRALVKLGAIYATGNCVPKDNAIAYHYFTRAHSVDPKNEWVEENRAILWANMTEDERARVRTEDGSIE